MITRIDLNCDVGEGMGNESLLFPYISSCNIATGGHAGDIDSMREVASLAIKHQVRIGAHPSYPDPQNFGRVSLEMEKRDFQESMAAQLNSLLEVLAPLKVTMNHIKAHGALYNDLAPGGRLALEYLEVLTPFKESQILYAPCGSEFAGMAREQGFHVWEEAFADRAYRADGGLVSRTLSGAVHTDPEVVVEQVLEMSTKNQVRCADGSFFSMKPDTICIHGDNPAALEILKMLTAALPESSIQVKK